MTDESIKEVTENEALPSDIEVERKDVTVDSGAAVSEVMPVDSEVAIADKDVATADVTETDSSADSVTDTGVDVDVIADDAGETDTGAGAVAYAGTDTDMVAAVDDSAETDSITDADVIADTDVDADSGEYAVSKAKLEMYDWLQCVVFAIICGIFIFVFAGRTIGVEGDSMRNTLYWNDMVIMSGIFYTPKNGDIIIFRPLTHDYGDTPLVKRVIATAGQTLDINFETGEVSVNGTVLDEHEYIRETTKRKLDFKGPVTIPEGYVFVMGDNRNNSSDSRDSRVGLVDTRLIIGKVLMVAIPGSNDNNERDWSRAGFVH